MICLASIIFTNIDFTLRRIRYLFIVIIFFGGGGAGGLIIIGDHNHAVLTTVRIMLGFAIMFIEYTYFVY